MSFSQLTECELQCINIVDKLNIEISQNQAECESHVADQLKVNGDLQTLGQVIDGFRDVKE